MRRKLIGKHLNKREVLSSRLVVKYHDKRPPDKAAKRALVAAASTSCSVMLKTVWAIDKVCLFHFDETPIMTQVLDEHFCFKNLPGLASTRDAKKKLVNAKARRTWLGLIRKNMLSVSFHLNTGMYLLDTDAGNRTIVGDNEIDTMNKLWAKQEWATDANGNYLDDPTNPGFAYQQPKVNAAGKRTLSENIEGYAQTGSSGPVHVSFEFAKTYSALQFSRLIIHEASHTYCGTSDVRYAHANDYSTQRPNDMISNADSYGYAACSIAAGTFYDYEDLAKGPPYS